MVIHSVITDSLLVIRDFIRIHLGKDPLTLLGKVRPNVLIRS